MASPYKVRTLRHGEIVLWLADRESLSVISHRGTSVNYSTFTGGDQLRLDCDFDNTITYFCLSDSMISWLNDELLCRNCIKLDSSWNNEYISFSNNACYKVTVSSASSASLLPYKPDGTIATWGQLDISSLNARGLYSNPIIDGELFENRHDMLRPSISRSSGSSASGTIANGRVDSVYYVPYVYELSAAGYAIAEEFYSDLEPDIPPAPQTDPYETGGGSSTTGGGTGSFSETGDVVGIPSLPTLSAVDTGFITLFNPSASQVKSLASYMWSQNFDISLFKNVVANPMDCILGLTIVPVDPPNAGSKAVTVGNINTGITLPYLSSQYVEVDCGTLNVNEFWGSYLDYSPYTKMGLYLPYIGIVPLDIDDVMSASVHVVYHVDVLSGACVAYVLCNGTQLYTYIGQCSSNVPVTSNDFTNTVNGILGIAGSIGSLVATGGASAPTEMAGMAGNAINALKPNIQKSGAMSGTGGLMGVQTPYLLCQRPRQSVPAGQNTFTGYPSNINAKLSDLSGYTEVDRIHLDGIPCTNEELMEIQSLLESGVFI